MPKKIVEFTTEQKNISKKFLLCNCSSCVKDDNEVAAAKILCPFCWKVGYCSYSCMNKDIVRHDENECQKNMCVPTFKNNGSKPTSTSKPNNNTLENINKKLNDNESDSEDGSLYDNLYDSKSPKKSNNKKLYNTPAPRKKSSNKKK